MERKKSKTLTERYCPVVCRNVALELPQEGPHGEPVCLNLHNCMQENGGCRNKLIHRP
jgi:hypothetical protein